MTALPFCHRVCSDLPFCMGVFRGITASGIMDEDVLIQQPEAENRLFFLDNILRTTVQYSIVRKDGMKPNAVAAASAFYDTLNGRVTMVL